MQRWVIFHRSSRFGPPVDVLSLLKIQFGAIEGRDKQHRAASPILRSSTLITMMQAADLREGNNVIACEG
jgi:hypothetical protein